MTARTQASESTCIHCGCTDTHACDGGCYWARVDRVSGFGVCSACPSAIVRFDRGSRKLTTAARLEVDMRREFGA